MSAPSGRGTLRAVVGDEAAAGPLRDPALARLLAAPASDAAAVGALVERLLDARRDDDALRVLEAVAGLPGGGVQREGARVAARLVTTRRGAGADGVEGSAAAGASAMPPGPDDVLGHALDAARRLRPHAGPALTAWERALLRRAIG